MEGSIDLNTAEPWSEEAPGVDPTAVAGAALSPSSLLFKPRRSKFTIEDFDDLQPLSCSWRVKGLWPAIGLCFIAGPSGSGKSFLALDALARICQGRAVLGRKTVPCGVLYVASEAPHGVRARVAGLRTVVGPLGGQFKFIGQAPDLTDEGDVADLGATIAEEQARMAVAGHELRVVGIDTLSASIPGADENSSQHMSRVLAALQSLALRLRVLIVVIAHTGKQHDRGMRGWSGLRANADGVIILDEEPTNGVRGGQLDKVKDGESGTRFAFSLRQIDLGEDDDGDRMTTCVVEEQDAPHRPPSGRRPTRANADGELILRAFNRQLPEKGVAMQAAGLRPGQMGLRLADVREDAFRQGLGPSQLAYDDLPDKASQAAARTRGRNSCNRAFDRAKTKLIADRRLRQEGDVLWIIEDERG